METLESLYDRYCAGKTSIAAHLPRLRHLASGLTDVIEFGVRRGASSTALLLGADQVTSYDVQLTHEACALAALEPRWTYRIQSSLDARVEVCDLLFIDSLHTFAQLQGELKRHAHMVSHMIVFHDTLTFGSVGADGESGLQLWDYSKHPRQSVPEVALGIRPAIDDLMIRDTSWHIMEHSPLSHGLLVLKRR